jgi:23S rRNA pseudouridine1911/1915/1917 synthase
MEAEHEAPQGVRLVVADGDAGQPLIEFVSLRLINESKTRLRGMIGNGEIRLNGHRCGAGRYVQGGDVVQLSDRLDTGVPPVESPLELQILHEDESHLCVFKPAGHNVLPGRGGHGDEFYISLLAWVNRDSPSGGPYCRPHVVHRLDRQTSGVLLVAKTVEAGRALGRQFERRLVQKTYLALVEGAFPRDEAVLDIPLARQPGHIVKMIADPRNGKQSLSEVKVAERFGHFTLLRVQPRTGRQHQIRVHLSAAGYPLLVDLLYGRRDCLAGRDVNTIVGGNLCAPDDVLMARMPLHAAAIAYAHPVTGDAMTWEAPLPEDFCALLALLRQVDSTA